MRRLGYERRRVPLSPEVLAARTGTDAAYYKDYATRWPTFAPWTAPEFQALYTAIADFTAGTPERGYLLLSLARYAKQLPGDFAECGVYRGGSALLLCHALEGTNKRLYLFDSFEGLPKPDSDHDPFFREGEYAASLDAVRERLRRYSDRLEYRKGWIPDTFAGVGEKRFALAHVDVDLYQPTLESARFLYPRLIPGGVMVFDEYGFSSAHGEKIAVDEFFADKPEQPIALITGQAFIIKVPPPS